ncbi:hypothetical protein B0T18DRAFT_402074 [Schizothecium vesticola]|uniref:Uncharacterized protein n=1 Tax=Schizothecium vesticola TaxID=314040 RepID=A0AA40K9V5_9PEZI|nr:hypothetical protein B0T18DRAFT_402074 [Schizothecium vesticola]
MPDSRMHITSASYELPPQWKSSQRQDLPATLARLPVQRPAMAETRAMLLQSSGGVTPETSRCGPCRWVDQNMLNGGCIDCGSMTKLCSGMGSQRVCARCRRHLVKQKAGYGEEKLTVGTTRRSATTQGSSTAQTGARDGEAGVSKPSLQGARTREGVTPPSLFRRKRLSTTVWKVCRAQTQSEEKRNRGARHRLMATFPQARHTGMSKRKLQGARTRARIKKRGIRELRRKMLSNGNTSRSSPLEARRQAGMSKRELQGARTRANVKQPP